MTILEVYEKGSTTAVPAVCCDRMFNFPGYVTLRFFKERTDAGEDLHFEDNFAVNYTLHMCAANQNTCSEVSMSNG